MFRRPQYGYRRRGEDDGQFLQAVFVLSTLADQARRLPVKPPVTLALAGLMAAIHFRSLLLGDAVVSQCALIQLLCLRPSAVVERGEWLRLLTGQLLHADEYHLYYNLASFVAHGAQLEPEMGSAAYGRLLVRLVALGGVLHVALAAALSPAEYAGCCVGWSGVCFALKTVLTAGAAGGATAAVGPWTMPLRYASWGELVWISVLNPRASFIGHLAGILAGCAELAGGRLWRRLVGWLAARPGGGGGGPRRPPPPPPRPQARPPPPQQPQPQPQPQQQQQQQQQQRRRTAWEEAEEARRARVARAEAAEAARRRRGW